MEKLIYVDDSLPGISRKGAGTGFAYYDPEGELIRDSGERKRLNAIALPPAYRDAWFCPAPNGHILATGYDDADRKQYRYHPDFRRMREGDKFDRCEQFGNMLPLIRARVDEDLSQKRVTSTRAIAAVVRLLDLSAIRIGNEQYARSNDSFGATTLRSDHVDVTSRSVHLSFTAKGGKEREVTLGDPRLARTVRRMADLPSGGGSEERGDHLFRYLDDKDESHPVRSGEVNDYLRETLGGDFTAKHFRTWHASVLAFEQLASGKGRMTIGELLEVVAEHLGNTKAIARKSYVHPIVIEQVDRQEEWRASLKLPRASKWLSPHERGLLELLKTGPAAADLIAA
ncbi:MAG: DNA topoisomerase IB [Erythrobacter sp.]|jgi:DNA topoisomerase-1|nr:DNA topoisomerase IB [Erythrobacter sp.]